MNKELLDDEMIITDSNGDEKVMKILFTYENEERGKSYVFLYEENDEDNIFLFSYDEKNKTLEEIEEEEEYKEAEEVLNAFDLDKMK